MKSRRIFRAKKNCSKCDSSEFVKSGFRTYSCLRCNPNSGLESEWRPYLSPTIYLVSSLILSYIWLAITYPVTGMEYIWISTEGLKIWGVDNEKILSGEFYRIITGAFVHTDILHILFNIIVLVIAGARLEHRKSGAYILPIFFLGVLLTNIVSLERGLYYGHVGSSGGVLTLLAFLLFHQHKDYVFGYLESSIFVFLTIIMSTDPSTNIYSHYGGLMIGTLLGILYRPLEVIRIDRSV